MAERAVGWGRERAQHVDFHRKVLLRKRMMRWLQDGAIYVPFCGEGDLAFELYQGREVLAADFDPEFVETASQRMVGDFRSADCDIFPFQDFTGQVALADFDAWADPWPAFLSFWRLAKKTDRIVMFFTDGHRMNVMGDGLFIHPDGSRRYITEMQERRRVYYAYLSEHIWPWFDDYVKPYRLVERMRYQRGIMLHWGVVLAR